MSHRTGIYSFLAIYLLILVFSYLGHSFTYQDSTTELPSIQLWLYTTSQVTFTHAYTGLNFVGQPASFHFFSAITMLLSSWLFHALLLWLVWQLFVNSSERSLTVAKSFASAGLVLLLCELVLTAFFLYAIPSELTSGSHIQKILAACTLSINSFNNAGFSNWNYFFDENPLAGNFMIQVGVIGGTVLGSLGIYVIIDLFSPLKLRERLADPTIDWKFITKISLFGAAGVFILYAVVQYLMAGTETLADKNILESLSSILMKGVSARGFGWDLQQQTEDSSNFLHAAVTFFGAGPFTTGGGATLLLLVFLYAIIKGKTRISFHINMTFKIVKIWLILFTMFLSVMYLISFAGSGTTSLHDLFYLYTNHHMEIVTGENMISLILKSLGMIAGRFSFVATCMLVLNQNKHASGIF